MKNPSGMILLLSYLSGVSSVILVLSLFIGYKIGFSNLYKKLRLALFPSWKSGISLPQDILEDLIQAEAVIGGYSLNPTKQDKYNTILLQPHNELAYTLRPNAQIKVSTLRSQKPLNFNPPILQLRKNHTSLSSRIKMFLETQSRLSYSYSTDENGFRKTVPLIQSDKQILLIGAAVPFGVGVDDEFTVASHLQQLIGPEYRITNSSVCGYSARQILLRTKHLSSKTKFNGLIYVASQHDFMYSEAMRRFSQKPRPLTIDWVAEAEKILEGLKSISDRFDGKICIVLHTYLEYSLVDLFLEKGWREEMIEKTHALRAALPEITKKLGFDYCDWSEIVNNFMKKEKSIMSRFALYADHCHASPLGNELMAKKIFSTIMDKWLIEESTYSN